jgi:dihydropteroate synthase
LTRPLVMGIVNVTPDSFSDGGRYAIAPAAVEHALKLVEEGADILDIGGESTRPGAAHVSIDEELSRVVPVIESLRDVGVPISIDTQKPEVMGEAMAAGASMVNDVNALCGRGTLEVAAASDCGICLMHKQGAPETMQTAPTYGDVVSEVMAFLAERVQAARAVGIGAERLLIDPGFGFGKNLEHNVELLRNLGRFHSLGIPVLVGLSRKSMLGRITGSDVGDRLAASVTAAVLAAQRGAAVIRVHDVRATKDALAVMHMVEGQHE